jgi:hypothetical protein
MLNRCFWGCLLGLLLCCPLFAQSPILLTGQLYEEQGQPLVGATVLLLQLPDSSLVAYATSDQQGRFRLEVAAPMDGLLEISFLGYEPYQQRLFLAEATTLAAIALQPQKQLLEAVEVTEERLPLQFKGDTLVYNAQAFETQAHDNVEALIKQLPGLQVDRDGQVKAQGERVDRILVDGQEFFGDNPAVALKNLPADAVDQVEVYDRKSELAEFSGVDDGVRKKTINLTLKEDKKQGFFGQVQGGYGWAAAAPLSRSGQRYLGNLSAHYFNPKLRLSTIGNLNNLNQPNFSFMDYFDLMGGLEAVGSGAVDLELTEEDLLYQLLLNNNEGLSQRLGGGVNLNYRISDQTTWNSHYFYSFLDKQKKKNSYIRSIAPEDFFTMQTQEQQQVKAHYHQWKYALTHQLDSSQDLRWNGSMTWNNSQRQAQTQEARFGQQQQALAQLQQQQQQAQQAWGVNSTLLYRKKLNNKGRIGLSKLLFGYSYNHENLQATQMLLPTPPLQQQQTQQERQQRYGGELAWVEPFGKGHFLELKLSGSWHLEQSQQVVQESIGDSLRPVPSLTNAFRKHYDYQQFTARFQRQYKAYTLTVEAAAQRSHLKGRLQAGTPLSMASYYYPLVAVNFKHKFSKSSRLNLRYSTRIQEPNIEQLQPATDIRQALSLRSGNPQLVPEYHHQWNFDYHLFDQFSFTSLFVRASATLLKNPIVYAQTIDANLRSQYRPENSDWGWRTRFFVDFSRPIKPLQLIIKLGLLGVWQEQQRRLNGLKNKEWQQQYDFKISIENRKKKTVDALLGTQIVWNKSDFSINPSLNTSYVTYTAFAQCRVTIAQHWQISSQLDYQLFVDPAFERNWQVPIWSAKANYTWVKLPQLQVEVSVYNLLNQRLWVQRFNQGQVVGESQSTTLGRYLMVALRYKFSPVGPAPSKR